MRRKLMLLLTCLLIGIGLVNAQTSKVTGVVTSEEDGLPVVGASIMVKGTTIGTVTDLDGKFTLPNVPSSAENFSHFIRRNETTGSICQASCNRGASSRC